MNYSKIKQVYETSNVEEVNKMLLQEWKILTIYKKSKLNILKQDLQIVQSFKLTYVLGYVPKKQVEVKEEKVFKNKENIGINEENTKIIGIGGGLVVEIK